MKTNDPNQFPPLNLHRQWVRDDEREHDDLMDADAHDRRRYERDGWAGSGGVWDGR
jgi:hypothetical protein